jgi:hypothetical protein
MFGDQKSSDSLIRDSHLADFVCDIRHNGAVTSNLVLNRRVRPISPKRLRVPPARRPSEGTGPFLFLIRHLRPNLAVLTPEKQQRVALADHNVLHFRNKDGVIAGFLRRLQPAFQVRQSCA